MEEEKQTTPSETDEVIYGSRSRWRAYRILMATLFIVMLAIAVGWTISVLPSKFGINWLYALSWDIGVICIIATLPKGYRISQFAMKIVLRPGQIEIEIPGEHIDVLRNKITVISRRWSNIHLVIEDRPLTLTGLRMKDSERILAWHLEERAPHADAVDTSSREIIAKNSAELPDGHPLHTVQTEETIRGSQWWFRGMEALGLLMVPPILIVAAILCGGQKRFPPMPVVPSSLVVLIAVAACIGINYIRGRFPQKIILRPDELYLTLKVFQESPPTYLLFRRQDIIELKRVRFFGTLLRVHEKTRLISGLRRKDSDKLIAWYGGESWTGRTFRDDSN